ncbi:MAG: hypothetical protein HFP77_00250, partial [Methylococcales symbiont of Iophon sp. n. MRB-2018]
VRDKSVSIRRAAEQFNVPKSTLSDRVSGKVKFGSHSGPERYLTDHEEEELFNFISECAKMGYAKTKLEILAIVKEIVSSKGKDVHVSSGWWESFKHRHPQLTLRTVEKLSYVRFVMTDESIITRYFDLLEQTLLDNELAESPSMIFNCDESGLPLEHAPSSVVALKGQKHPRAITSGNKKQITVLACGNASGFVIPPLVIFARKALNPKLTVGEVPGTMYGLSDSGWMNSDIFDNWFTHHFLIHAPSSRPLLLILDGHSSHYSPQFITRAAHEKVIVFCLPPNTTHLTQPLDKSAFGPLKTYWNQECQVFMSRNPGRVVTQFDFMNTFSKAWYRAMTVPNIMSAFHTTGIYPFNRHAVKLVDSPPRPKSKLESLTLKTGLAFIPLYSPARSCASHPLAGSPAPELCVSGDHEEFTQEEEIRFSRRYEEGYDLVIDDDRYKLWLKKNGSQPPDSATSNTSNATPPSNLLLGTAPVSTLKKLLPPPPQRTVAKRYNQSGKVLTSLQHRRMIEEKERLKNEKLEEKERKKLERERKKLEQERIRKEKAEEKKRKKLKTKPTGI